MANALEYRFQPKAASSGEYNGAPVEWGCEMAVLQERLSLLKQKNDQTPLNHENLSNTHPEVNQAFDQSDMAQLKVRLDALKQNEIDAIMDQLQTDKSLLFKALQFLAPDLRNSNNFKPISTSPDVIDQFTDFAMKYIQGLRTDEYSDWVREDIDNLTRPMVRYVLENKDMGLTDEFVAVMTQYLDRVRNTFAQVSPQPGNEGPRVSDNDWSALERFAGIRGQISNLIEVYTQDVRSPQDVATQRVVAVLEALILTHPSQILPHKKEAYLQRIEGILFKVTKASADLDFAPLRDHITFGDGNIELDYQKIAAVNRCWIKLRDELNQVLLDCTGNAPLGTVFAASI